MDLPLSFTSPTETPGFFPEEPVETYLRFPCSHRPWGGVVGTDVRSSMISHPCLSRIFFFSLHLGYFTVLRNPLTSCCQCFCRNSWMFSQQYLLFFSDMMVIMQNMKTPHPLFLMIDVEIGGNLNTGTTWKHHTHTEKLAPQNQLLLFEPLSTTLPTIISN